MRGGWLRKLMLRMRWLSTACGLKRQAPTDVTAKHHLRAVLSCHAASVTLSMLLFRHCTCMRLSLVERSRIAEKGSMELKGLEDPVQLSGVYC